MEINIASPITPGSSGHSAASITPGSSGYSAATSSRKSRGSGGSNKRKADGENVSFTPPSNRRKQLSAEEFYQRGKLEETWRKSIGHWRRFHNWLSTTEHAYLCIPGHNLKNADAFKAVFVPVPTVVFNEYIAFYGHKDDNLLKAKSTMDSFWSALVWFTK